MHKRLITLLALVGLAVVVSALAAGAQPIPRTPDAPASMFAIPWWTVDSGGGASQGGAYAIRGTSGQAEAGTSSGGAYVLVGGFMPGAIGQLEVYLPLVVRR